jgi:hypothetical protein
VGVAASENIVLGFLRITILKCGCQVRHDETCFRQKESKKFLAVFGEVNAFVEVVKTISNEAELHV